MKRVAILAALFLWPALAQAAEVWTVYKDDRRGTVLSAMPNELESDTDLWIACRKDGRLTVGAGANGNIGKGDGKKNSVTLTSADKTATLTGVSKESLNFPMTGGTELVTTVAQDDALFAVLRTGKPIRMGTTVIGTRGLQKKLAAFFAACPARK